MNPELLQSVKSSARKGMDPSTRVIEESMIPYGKVIRQGDVYLRRHPMNFLETSGIKTKATDERQIAPGITTGSRHIVRDGATVLKRENASETQGPLIVAEKGFYLEHPKHADMDCRAPGVYEVTFPVDKLAEELGEIKRRQD